MDQNDDPAELERRLEQVTRLSSSTTDQTTLDRFRTFAEDLRQKLLRALARRKVRIEERFIRDRAYELWDSAGKPGGRDEEFWLQAEREIKGE